MELRTKAGTCTCLLLGLLLAVVADVYAAGTGTVGVVSGFGRHAPDPLGYPYYQIKYIRAGVANGTGGAWNNGGEIITSIANHKLACAMWDTLRIGRDFNSDGTVDSTFTSGERTSRDYARIRYAQVVWMGSATDTLWVKFLTAGNLPLSTTVLGKLRIVDPTYDILEFPAQCDRIAVSGGRTNVAGAWIVIAYAGP